MVRLQRFLRLPATRYGVFRRTHHEQFVTRNEDLPVACLAYVVDQH